MRGRTTPRLARFGIGILLLLVVASLILLVWFGYRAVYGWQASAAQVASRRANETAALVVSEFAADMHGVQSRVLSSPQWDELALDSPDDAISLVASAFARYPYPESFFVWTAPATQSTVAFLERSDRRPSWRHPSTQPIRFPVVVTEDEDTATLLTTRIRRDIQIGRRFSTFELTLHGATCQVVGRVLYRDPLRQHVEGVVGFIVNLSWVKQVYFPELMGQVGRVIGLGSGLAVSIVDDRGAAVVGPIQGAAISGSITRSFPLLFFDPQLISVDPPDDQPRREWAVIVGSGDDPTLRDAVRGGRQTLVVATVAAGVLALGVLLTIRASRASTRLAQLRSEFVASVTHELKTPIASIRGAGETLSRGRVTGAEAQREYADLVVQESRRLTRLVDNLLAFSRITDVTEAYAFAPVNLRDLIDEVLRGFRLPLTDQRFQVDVDMPDDLPPIRADRTAALLLFDNLVDNAIRYSEDTKSLTFRASAVAREVVIEVSDRGRGIPDDEVDLVTRRFFRGRGAGSGGSGLGLAIASRIVHDHGGRLSIRSRVGEGTTITVGLPAGATSHV